MLSVLGGCLRSAIHPHLVGLRRRHPKLRLSVGSEACLASKKLPTIYDSGSEARHCCVEGFAGTTGRAEMAKVRKYGMLSWIGIIMQVD